MKRTVLMLLLICLTGSLALAQQTNRPLTPAEQKQKERVERELLLQREIREESARKQQEYEAKQAEKERKKAARQSAKDNPDPATGTRPTAPSATIPESKSDQGVTETPGAAPAVVQPRQKREKKEKARPEPVGSAPAPGVSESVSDRPKQPAAVTEPETAPARPIRKERAVRVKPEKKSPLPLAEPAPAEPQIMSRPKHEFLPKGHLFDPILLDPLEAQTYGSVLPAYYTEGRKYKGSIVPFAFGFTKPFYRRTTAPGRAEELVLDLASFTQFEVFFDQDKGKQLRRIMNNDYKVSISYNLRRGENNYRIRAYHISSHLGDDYIFRNSIRAPTPNSVNYEQLDVTYSRTVNDWRLYGGLGVVLRKKEERDLLSAQLGAFYKKPSDRMARLVGGVDVKFWQQTDFRPGIHGGIGVEVGRTQNNLTFLLEGYSGFRPYSQFEQQQTSWIGLGVYLNPF